MSPEQVKIQNESTGKTAPVPEAQSQPNPPRNEPTTSAPPNPPRNRPTTSAPPNPEQKGLVQRMNDGIGKLGHDLIDVITAPLRGR